VKETLIANIRERLGNLYEPESYFRIVSQQFENLGFFKGNTIAGALTCRDELCYTLTESIKQYWGNPFILSGLAGIPVCGKSALKAMISHAPTNGDVERYVFFVFSHIGYDGGKEEGACIRPGRKEMSSACGALIQFLEMLKSGNFDLIPDPLDWELSYLKLRLLRELPFGRLPTLWELTQIVVSVSVNDLLRQLSEIVDREKVHYAIASAIHIHTSQGDFILPKDHFAHIEGRRVTLKI